MRQPCRLQKCLKVRLSSAIGCLELATSVARWVHFNLNGRLIISGSRTKPLDWRQTRPLDEVGHSWLGRCSCRDYLVQRNNAVLMSLSISLSILLPSRSVHKWNNGSPSSAVDCGSLRNKFIALRVEYAPPETAQLTASSSSLYLDTADNGHHRFRGCARFINTHLFFCIQQ